MIVLDTNVLSELMRKQPETRVLDWVDRHTGSGFAITAVTLAELLCGVARLRSGSRKRNLDAAVRGLVRDDFAGRVLPFGAGAADHFAALVAERERNGRPVSTADGQIAAICRHQGAALATRNVRDFELTKVELLDPWASG
jgi:predicted nucleic acid-binding protein